MRIVCVNNGYANTKVKSATGEIIFESRIREAIDIYETNVVSVGGKSLVVGDGQLDVDLNKTNSTTQRACLELALKKVKASDGIHLISAMPINAYLNTKARAEYSNMLDNVPGVTKSHVYMEGMAAVLSDISWYKDKLICLLDFGGLTVNAMLVENGKLVPNTAFSMQLGTIILENRIRKALEQTELENIPDYQIKYMGDKPQVMSVIRDYIREIKQELKKAQYPTSMDYRLTGGGAAKHSVILKRHFNGAYVCQDAIWENVRGLWLLGSVICK